MRSIAGTGVLLLALTAAACNGPTDATEASPPQATSQEPAVRVAAGSEPNAPVPIIEESASPDTPTRILDPRADAILREMSRFLAAAPGFVFEAEESFDEIPSGQPRLLLTNIRRVAVQRPNRFAADADGDSLHRSVWYDGRSVTALDKATNTYATISVPDTIDAALDTLSERYGVNVPLADLLYADPYEVLTVAATYSRYLGIHLAALVPCHHIVLSGPEIEWQIWIDAGERPLLRKIAITYVREPGEPQYVATIWSWRLSPTIPGALFRFEAPEGAERVDAATLAAATPGISR